MNQKRSNLDDYNEEFKNNKNAFDDVIGDPFALEPITGHYIKLHSRSSIRVANNEFDMGKATKNAAQPNLTDFFCDVDRICTIGTGDAIILEKFVKTYITEETETEFTPKERSAIEQKLGKLFRRHKLSPVSKYFTTIRQQSVRAAKERNQHGSTSRSTCLSL